MERAAGRSFGWPMDYDEKAQAEVRRLFREAFDAHLDERPNWRDHWAVALLFLACSLEEDPENDIVMHALAHLGLAFADAAQGARPALFERISLRGRPKAAYGARQRSIALASLAVLELGLVPNGKGANTELFKSAAQRFNAYRATIPDAAGRRVFWTEIRSAYNNRHRLDKIDRDSIENSVKLLAVGEEESGVSTAEILSIVGRSLYSKSPLF